MSASVAAPAGRGEEWISETQERFLRAAAARLPLERVVELHLFPALRQGGIETGFAVIAAHRQPTPVPANDAPGIVEPPTDEIGGSDATEASASMPPDVGEADDADEAEPTVVDPAPADERLVVFSARYRLTLKGPDRGRWEVEVVEEADAPLVTVDAVVRGMQRRIGEGAEPERLTPDQLHDLLDEPPGATTRG